MREPSDRTLWERVGESLQEWYSEAVGWTGEKARIGVKKVDILGVQHNIKRSMTHLGGRVYDLMQRDLPVESDEQVQRIVSDLRGFEDELAAREREIDALRNSRRAGEGRGAEAEGPEPTSEAETVASGDTGRDSGPTPTSSS